MTLERRHDIGTRYEWRIKGERMPLTLVGYRQIDNGTKVDFILRKDDGTEIIVNPRADDVECEIDTIHGLDGYGD